MVEYELTVKLYKHAPKKFRNPYTYEIQKGGVLYVRLSRDKWDSFYWWPSQVEWVTYLKIEPEPQPEAEVVEAPSIPLEERADGGRKRRWPGSNYNSGPR